MSIIITQDTFLERCREAHGNKYDYSKAVYTKQTVKVVIVCPEHGEFLQSPVKHWAGQGCKECKKLKIADALRGDPKEIIEKCAEIHNGLYDYSKVVYQNLDSKVEIVCPAHGSFFQTLANHRSGKGCTLCRNIKISKSKTLPREKAISNFVKAHGDTYSYDNVDYKSSDIKVSITCSKHGDFLQVPYSHTAGKGCPRCVSLISSEENNVYEYIKQLGFEVEQSNRSILKGKELDIFVPSKNLAIEVNGVYWHSDLKKERLYHYNKFKACQEKGIRLLQITDYEWNTKRNKMENLIKNSLGASDREKINARSCEVISLTAKECKDFYEQNHPQGHSANKINYGLKTKEGTIVAIMSFGYGKTSRGSGRATAAWELSRYATSASVRGGASKLFKAFIREHNPDEVRSFSMNDWFDGGLYKTLGFTGEEIKPDYRVFHHALGLLSKSHWQRRNIQGIIEKLGVNDYYDHETDPRSEKEMIDLLKGVRIWDSGKIRWTWKPLTL